MTTACQRPSGAVLFGKHMRIGVMGARGSFSEEAGLVYAKKWLKTKDFKISYLVTADATLDALAKGQIDIAILALENSTMGVVQSSIYAIAKHVFSIKKIFSIDVRHCLMARKGTSKRQIREIVSQDPALQQCKKYLARKWPKTKIREYEDTAKAAEDLSSGTLPATCAVIASKAAAKAYGLVILEESIQDLKNNSTTFIVAAK
jgi:prephenate dehydratase